MKDQIALTRTKVGLSIKNTLWLMSNWKYASLAFIVAFIFFELIYWLFNLSIISTILTSTNVPFYDKIKTLLSPVESIQQASGSVLLVMMLALAVLQGVIIASLVYIVRRQKKIDDKLASGSSLVAVLAVVGLGCPACGTSLITPIVALFVSGSATAVSEKIAIFVTPFALAIAMYGVYMVGLRISNVRMIQNQKST